MECSSPPGCCSSFHLFSLGLITPIITTVGCHLQLSMTFVSSGPGRAQPSPPDPLNKCLCYNQGQTEHFKYCFESLNTQLCSKCKLRRSRPDLFLIKIGVILLQRLDAQRIWRSFLFPTLKKAVLSHRGVKSQDLILNIPTRMSIYKVLEFMMGVSC